MRRQYQALIAADVKADTRKLYSYEAFESGIGTLVQDFVERVAAPSSSDEIGDRRASGESLGLKLVALLGSVRSDRQGIKAARYVQRMMEARGHDLTLVDPLEVKLPLLDRMYKEYEKGKAPAVLEELAVLYRSADAFVIVSGEYNHSIPPALSNLLDHFLEEYFFRPSAIVCYSAAPSAASERRCSCGRCCASSGCQASRACSRFRRLGARSTSMERLRTPASIGASSGLPPSSSGTQALREARRNGVPY